MKKSILIIVSIILSLASCDKTTPLADNDSLKQFDAHQIYGDVHNALLSYANDNFTQTRASVSTLNDGIKYLSFLQQQGADNMPIDEVSRKHLKDGLEVYKNWYVTDNMYTTSFTKTRSGKNEIESNFELLLDNKLIDVFEYEGLITLSQATEANYKGELAVADFLDIVNSLIERWKMQGYKKDSQYGETSAVVLAISHSSLTWWTENPDALRIETRALPAFVGADIAGALVGAVSSITYQLADSGSVGSWKAVGWNAASRAIVGSTGAVGKIGKWISNLF